MKKIIGAMFCFVFINLMAINTFAAENIDVYSVSQLMEELDVSKSELVNSDGSALNTLEVNNGDGTNTVYIFDEDIRYVDENGEVVDKDLSIVASSDERKIKEGYIATVKSNDIDTAYPFSLNSKGILMDNVQFIPINSNAVLTESNSESVSYNNVYEGIDLICKPQLEGFSGEFELNSLSDFEKLKFKVASEFPYEILCEEGNIYIKVSESEKYKLTGASILDEKEEVIGSSYFVLENNDTISMEYSLSEDVNQTEVVTTSLLMENISVENNSINQVTVFSDSISAIEDGYSYVGTNEEDIIARTYIKFDLTALVDIEYDRILSACYNNYLYDFGNSDIIETYFVTGECNYDYLEWNNMPDTGVKIFGQSAATNELEVDTSRKRSHYITNAVQAWLQGIDNNGIMLKLRNDDGWCKMSSYGSSYTYLAVTYSEYEDTPTTKGIERTYEPFYIINKNSKKTLHATEATSTGDIIQKSFDMSDNQKWVFVYNSSSYGRDLYKIKLYNSNVYLQIDTNQTHETCVSLSTNSSSDNLLWYIVRNWDGSYKILPKSLYLEESLAVHDSSTLDNANICLETTTVDFAQEDDWTLIPANRDNATLYGIEQYGGLITSLEVSKQANNFMLSDYTCDIYIDKPADTILQDLFSSQIWYFSSHGNNARMYCYNKLDTGITNQTAIGLVDGTELDEGDEGENVTVYGIKNYDGNLNKLQLAFFDSCSTGANKDNESLVGAMYEEGAHCIVSFIRSCGDTAAQEWYGYLNLALNKSDVDTAIIFADRMQLYSGWSLMNTNARHVLGDTSIFYNYNAIAVDDSGLTQLNDDVEDLALNYNEIMQLDESLENEGTLIQYAYTPDADNYYINLDDKGNLYGYMNDTNELVFYSMNRRNANFSGGYPTFAGAMNCCASFLNKIGYSISDYSYEASNEYSSEFILELNSKTEVLVGDTEKIIVYVELDSNNGYYVTFYKAIKNEG